MRELIHIVQVRLREPISAIVYMKNSMWCPYCGEHNTWEAQRKIRAVPMKWATAVIDTLRHQRDWTCDVFDKEVVYTFYSNRFREVKQLDDK